MSIGPRAMPAVPGAPPDERFGAVVGSLGTAGLFRTPFNLETSATLAANGTAGIRQQSPRLVHIEVYEIVEGVPGQPCIRREILNLTVDRAVAAALLVETGVDLELEEGDDGGQADHRGTN